MNNTTLLQAIELGFDFDQYADDQSFNEIMPDLIDFMNENYERLPQIEDECEINSHGRSQTVSYEDFVSSGDIMDFSAHWHKAPETKIFHSSFVKMDSEGKFTNINLYYLVGETDYNTPDGYIFDQKTKRHIKE